MIARSMPPACWPSGRRSARSSTTPSASPLETERNTRSGLSSVLTPFMATSISQALFSSLITLDSPAHTTPITSTMLATGPAWASRNQDSTTLFRPLSQSATTRNGAGSTRPSDKRRSSSISTPSGTPKACREAQAVALESSAQSSTSSAMALLFSEPMRATPSLVPTNPSLSTTLQATVAVSLPKSAV